MKTDIVLVGGARTAMAEYSGTPGYGKFKDISAIDLAAHASKAAIERSKVDPATIEHAVIGNALQTSNDAIYGARHVALKAGVPQASGALTVNRLCGSGIQSIINAAQMIQLGEAGTVLAGGMENMSQAPFVLHGAREGFRLGMQPPLQDLLFASLQDPYCGLYMAQTAEKIAKRLGVSREEQDAYALRSHQLGAQAVREGRFAEEIAPYVIETRKGELLIDTDDHIKPDTTAEGLAKLRAAFGKDGTVTAGNASGIVDGAASVVLTTAERAKADGLDEWARVVSYATVGVDPSEMGIGPVPAIRACLDRAGVSLSQVDRFEINEAFSAQYLGCEKELELDREKANVNGGAISLGHPLGATGTRLVLTLMYELRRSGLRYGVASACIGGGQGIAMLIENPRA
ncbi:Acetyl-CoA acetyltransferase [Planctomycetes bacterium Pla163]|uniref:Acetyl-CoA acetyltransferase n=1 Tax=Rohdeia mirabilis TaxID=2528008 RepID=A0A518CYE1_9BACT|nr:Acetyl-CoA acetyltransferase [Planctomycetes bacterium Pla163]